jgi:predicted ATPase
MKIEFTRQNHRGELQMSLFDVFLSHNSIDKPWVHELKNSLQCYGISVWLDKDEIRPGDLFAKALEEGLASSRAVALIISPEAVASGWVEAEYYRALALANNPLSSLQLIPVILRDAPLPGFAKDRNWVDFRDKANYAQNVWKLVWGITGRKPAQILDLSTSETPSGALPTSNGAPSEELWNVPSHNPFFTGRATVLEQLHNALTMDGVVALSGLGGIGKTQIAVEYAHRHRADYKAVLWVKADSREALLSGFVAIAGLLSLPGKDAQGDENSVVDAVKKWLEGNHGWLLIFDNADDLALTRAFMPSSGKGYILCTTRARATGAMAQGVEIKKMEPEEGALFLLRRAQLIAKDASLAQATDDDQALAKAISTAMVGLPLALDQAGAFIEEVPSSLKEYLTLYRLEGAKLLAKRGDLAADHPSVTVTFALAFQQVETNSHAAADLLRVCAFLAPDAIPEELFTASATELGKHLGPIAASPLQFAQVIKEAGRFSLIKRHPTDKLLEIHQLVQEVLKDEMDVATQRAWAEVAVRLVLDAFVVAHGEIRSWSTYKRLLPHALAVAGHLKNLLATLEHAQQELDLQILLGPLLIATKGYAAPEVGQVYNRANELCQQVKDTPHLFPTLLGLHRFHYVQGELQRALEIGKQCLILARRQQKSALLLEARRALGVTVFMLGKPRRAQVHLKYGIALYDPQQHRSHALLYGIDPGVVCHSYAALNLWVLGYPDQALQRSYTAWTLAQESTHSHSLALALTFASWLHQYRRERQRTQGRIESLITLARDQGFPFWSTWGTILQGWMFATQGLQEKGITQIREGLAAHRAAGAKLWQPYFLSLLAEAYEESGAIRDGLCIVDKALAMMNDTGERWWAAELYRLKGQLLLRQEDPDEQQAVTCFYEALKIAHCQRAKSLELRAVMNLIHLWQQQGKRDQARQLLAPIYGWFTEGFDTADLQEAKALLEALG